MESCNKKDNGIEYIELPVPKRPDYFPDEQTQAEFLRIMTDTARFPVLIHDGSGKERVSMLTAVWLIKVHKATIPQTIKIISKINKRPATEAGKQFLQSLIR